MKKPLRILQLVGSPTNRQYADLSELYARGCLTALGDCAEYRFVLVHLAPDGSWRFPESLEYEAIADASTMSPAQMIASLAELEIDLALPQMFCYSGMTDVRALLNLLKIPYIGNLPLQMAIAADKSMAKAIVAAAGVAVPRSQLLHRNEIPQIPVPAVVKPNNADNSEGLSLVIASAAFPAALAQAFATAPSVIVEEYIELGREVRCGVVDRSGVLVALPLEEYYVDPQLRPVRRGIDKLKRSGDGDLTLAAKTRAESWIVEPNDSIVPAVQAAALQCYTALDSRHYNLFDFRVDPQGKPWFLEAGPYCSFAPQSVIVTMMEAAGIPLRQFFAEAIEAILGRRGPCEIAPTA